MGWTPLGPAQVADAGCLWETSRQAEEHPQSSLGRNSGREELVLVGRTEADVHASREVPARVVGVPQDMAVWFAPAALAKAG